MRVVQGQVCKRMRCARGFVSLEREDQRVTAEKCCRCYQDFELQDLLGSLGSHALKQIQHVGISERPVDSRLKQQHFRALIFVFARLDLVYQSLRPEPRGIVSSRSQTSGSWRQGFGQPRTNAWRPRGGTWELHGRWSLPGYVITTHVHTYIFLLLYLRCWSNQKLPTKTLACESVSIAAFTAVCTPDAWTPTTYCTFGV